jgi:NTE family protein
MLRLAVLMTALSAIADAWAQDEQSVVPDERAPIGLVLSGGGARGGAHIGVLKALEELRVPVDRIAGTSIGAIVGGFYVSGMSVTDLEQLVDSLAWQDAFLNVTPRRLRSYRRKRDDDLFLVDLKPGFNRGELQLPVGLVQGQVIDTIISRQTLPVSHVRDFDDLAIPFRAVAGDLATGEMVVLGSGNLARSLRASMSIPAVLSPISVDGRLLVDGGIAMNLPVGVAREMGAERIIAVDISSTLLGQETLTSVVDVTTQLTNLLTRGGTIEQRESLGPDDLLLVPEFEEDLGSTSFERMKDAIQAGYDAAMKHRAELEGFALSESEYAAHLAARKDPRLPTLPVIDFVTVRDAAPVTESIVEARLGDIEFGKTLDLDAVERAVNTVYGLEYYQNVRYSLVNDSGRSGLDLELSPRSWGPNYLQLGMEYSSAANEDVLFGLAASYLRTGINEHGGEWRATLVVGDEPAFVTDVHQPFGPKGLYFYAPSLNYESNRFNVFQGEERVTEAQLRELTLEFAVGRELLTWAEYRFGVRAAEGEFDVRVGDPTQVSEEKFRRGEFFGRFGIDTMDSIAFPRSGSLASAEWRASRQRPLEAEADFDQLLLRGAYAKTWGRHTLLTTFRYDATFSGAAADSRLFRMGGFLDLSGINRNELSGEHAARIGASYYRRVGNFTLFPAFAGISMELGNVWSSRDDISAKGSILGGSFWTGIRTPVGPIYVAYGRAEGGLDAFYITLGRVF